jgi:hypothetical protein
MRFVYLFTGGDETLGSGTSTQGRGMDATFRGLDPNTAGLVISSSRTGDWHGEGRDGGGGFSRGSKGAGRIEGTFLFNLHRTCNWGYKLSQLELLTACFVYSFTQAEFTAQASTLRAEIDAERDRTRDVQERAAKELNAVIEREKGAIIELRANHSFAMDRLKETKDAELIAAESKSLSALSETNAKHAADTARMLDAHETALSDLKNSHEKALWDHTVDAETKLESVIDEVSLFLVLVWAIRLTSYFVYSGKVDIKKTPRGSSLSDGNSCAT